MLVLSRKSQEEIRIGENITVRICAIQGDRVKIGITAPKDVPIHRHEHLPMDSDQQIQPPEPKA